MGSYHIYLSIHEKSSLMRKHREHFGNQASFYKLKCYWGYCRFMYSCKKLKEEIQFTQFLSMELICKAIISQPALTLTQTTDFIQISAVLLSWIYSSRAKYQTFPSPWGHVLSHCSHSPPSCQLPFLEATTLFSISKSLPLQKCCSRIILFLVQLL
jgi:hypothetical protein